MKQISLIWKLAVKDLKTEFRGPEVLLTSLTIAILVILIFGIAVERLQTDVIPAIFWVAIMFAATLGFTRSVQLERENGMHNAFRVAPIGGEIVIFGKALANFVLLSIVTVAIFALSVFFLGVDYLNLVIVAIHVAANLGISLIGTIFATITVRVRAREVLLALLLIPTVFPLLFAAVSISRLVLTGRPLDELLGWVAIIAIFDVISFAIVLFLGNTVVDE